MLPLELPGHILPPEFFNRDAQVVARALVGKVLCHLLDGVWLVARIIETEAYYRREKASHASLGFTEKRRALFMPPGTIYMYYARGGDSFNISCRGQGNAVLIKAGIPWDQAPHADVMLSRMALLNPLPGKRPRPLAQLCSGQTLLCRSLGLRVPDWDQQTFDPARLVFRETGENPKVLIRTTRLGIPPGRDGHLPYRFVDREFARFCTKNPLGGKAGDNHPVDFISASGRKLNHVPNEPVRPLSFLQSEPSSLKRPHFGW